MTPRDSDGPMARSVWTAPIHRRFSVRAQSSGAEAAAVQTLRELSWLTGRFEQKF
jgi:hypothetical protein